MAGGSSPPFLLSLYRIGVSEKQLFCHLFIHSFPNPWTGSGTPTVCIHGTLDFSNYCINHAVEITLETRNTGLQGGEL